MRFGVTALFTVVSLVSCSPSQAPAIELSSAIVVKTASGAAGYLTIENRGGEDRLKSVSSPSFGQIQIHQNLKNEDGVMRMRPIDSIAIPGNDRVMLKGGAMHLMLMQPLASVEVGDQVSLTLAFERHDPISIVALVAAPGEAS